MATYRNKNDEEIIYMPGEFKLRVGMDPVEDDQGGFIHMGDEGVAVKCTFYTNSGKRVVMTKNELIPVQDDRDHYVAPLKSTDLGKGTLEVKFEADIRDPDFDNDGDTPSGYRHEVVIIQTKIKIV